MNLKDDNICNYTRGFFDRSIFVEANLKKRFLVKQFFACLNQNMDFEAKLTKHFFFQDHFWPKDLVDPLNDASKIRQVSNS